MVTAGTTGRTTLLAVLGATSGCFGYVPVPLDALARTPIDEMRVRMTTDEGVIELDDARLRYPIVHGDVRTNTRPGEEPRIGTLASLDVQTATSLEVRRVRSGPTALIVTAATLTGIAAGFGLIVVGALASSNHAVP